MSRAPIMSAEEFHRLRTSDDADQYTRSAWAPATDAIWLEVIERWPEMRSWVAHNRTISAAIIERLAADPDPQVRGRIAMKRKLPDQVRAALMSDPDEVVARSARRFEPSS